MSTCSEFIPAKGGAPEAPALGTAGAVPLLGRWPSAKAVPISGGSEVERSQLRIPIRPSWSAAGTVGPSITLSTTNDKNGAAAASKRISTPAFKFAKPLRLCAAETRGLAVHQKGHKKCAGEAGG